MANNYIFSPLLHSPVLPMLKSPVNNRANDYTESTVVLISGTSQYALLVLYQVDGARTIWPDVNGREIDSGGTIVCAEVLASLLGPRGSLAGLGISDNIGVPRPKEAFAANSHL